MPPWLLAFTVSDCEVNFLFLNCLPHVAHGDREVFWSETKRNMGNEIVASVLGE